MKKFFTVILILIISCICTVSAQNNDSFINALRNCTPYNSSGEIDINGITAVTTKQMRGWQNDKCTYKESISFQDKTINTVCRFSRPQIDEIVSVADAYYLTQKYSQEEVDTSSFESVKNNPIAQVIGKYLQDSSVCTTEGL